MARQRKLCVGGKLQQSSPPKHVLGKHATIQKIQMKRYLKQAQIIITSENNMFSEVIKKISFKKRSVFALVEVRFLVSNFGNDD